MLRPHFQHKLRLAFLMLASALILLAEPVFARNSNRSNSSANRADSSARQNAQQQAPAARPSTPSPAPQAAPVARPQQQSRSESRPSVQSQSRSVVSTPSPSVRPQTGTQSRIVTNSPSSTVRTQSGTQSRVITNNPPVPFQSRSAITNTPTIQSQVMPNNSISTNRSVRSRENTLRNQESIPLRNNNSTISSSLTNILGSTIGSENRNSNYNSSIRSNSISNRETNRNITNELSTRNNVITNRNREIANSSNRAAQPVASQNTRISSELSSHIGDTIGSQPESTTNIRKQENSSSRNPVFLPFDRNPGVQRTTPQIETQQPAASSINRIDSGLSSRIGSQITTRNNSNNRATSENTQRNNRVTPPLNSEKQPVDNARNTSSLDRATTDIGTMISPDRTTPQTVRQPAANPNNRQENRNRSSIGNRIGEQETSQDRAQIRSYVGDSGRTNSNVGDRTNTRERTATRIDSQARPAQDNTRDITSQTNSRVDRRADSQTVEQSRSTSNSIDQTRITRVAPDGQTSITNDLHVRDSDGRRDLRVHRYEPIKPTRIVYRDRPYIRDSYHDYYQYVDRYDRLYRRSITPSFYFRVCYDRGSWLSVRYVYPYYQRKYVFVSLGGYWPSDYNYVRYYWYGSHPYYWYGYYPIAREVGTSVNYYTYNYYNTESPASYDTSSIPDSEYFDTVINQPAPKPADATLADTYFEEAVDAFDTGKYDLAIEKFSRAMELAPKDMILPFAYSQALFAAGRYSESAEVLRMALSKVKPDKEGVFYPRGLYPNDDVLMAQLDKLANEADEYSFDADLQLLLGYQLLGIGELDDALLPLKNASLDMKNKDAANVLLNLLLKIKVNDITSGENDKPENTEPNKTELNAEPVSQDFQGFTFKDSEASNLQAKNENEELKNTGNKEIVSEGIAANKPTHKKAKEGILLATIFVIAGSTGIGHLLHR